MNKYITTLLFSTLLCITSACEDVIDVNLRSVDPQLVIEGVVRMDCPAEVSITKTKDFDDATTYAPITEAYVTITDDAGNVEVLHTNAEGKYVASTIVGAERRTYHLSVTYEEVEYTSISRMPPRVGIDSLTLWQLPIKDFPDPMIHFKDPEGEENQYYRFIMAINGVRPTGSDRIEDDILSTEFVDGNAIHLPIFISYEANRDDDPIVQGDVVTVEMQCIDKGAYTFFDTLYSIDWGLANPTSNIKGGALGYFSAYSFTTADIVMEWD